MSDRWLQVTARWGDTVVWVDLMPPGSLAPPPVAPGPLHFEVAAVDAPPPLPRGIRLDLRLGVYLVASALLLGALLATATLWPREPPTFWGDDWDSSCGRLVVPGFPIPDVMVSLGDRSPSSIGCGRFVAVAEPRPPAIARAGAREPILDLVEVEARIRAIHPALERCFAGVEAPAHLEVTFSIDGEGRAIDARAIGTDGPGGCVVDLIRGLRFPPPPFGPRLSVEMRYTPASE